MILTQFKSHIPPYFIDQSDAIDWLARVHSFKSGTDMKRLVQRVACPPSQIFRRYHYAPDYCEINPEKIHLFNKNAKHRHALYLEITEKILNEILIEQADHLLHVTCTGYTAPSCAQMSVLKKGWQETTQVTHVYHMGCYAAFPALRIAERLKGIKEIVHTELCTLHFDPSNHTPENIVVQSLFGDGAIAYQARDDARVGLELLSLHEEMVPDSHQDMSWNPNSFGMEMSLSRFVPQKISEKIKAFTQILLDKAEVKFSHDLIWAIHPGGPKIIDRIKDKLELSEENIRFSRQILYQFGNMSSATLPFVWKSILEDKEIKSGTIIVSMAFGPGLTMSGGVFKKNYE